MLTLVLVACQPQVPATAATDAPLRLAGPAAVVSFPLMRLAQTGVATDAQVRRAQFQLWQSADQLRVLLAREEIDFSAAPTHVPALLANRGEPVRLLNVSAWGMLWLISRDPGVHDLGDLRGRRLVTPYRRDMGALTLHALLDARGLQVGRDIQLLQARDAQDAVALMLSGREGHVLLPEPTASLLLWRNRQAGGPALHRAQSLEAAWSQQFPRAPDLPQAGLMVAARLHDDAALASAIVDAYAQAARWCKTQVRDCALLAQRHLPHIPLPVLESAIRVTRLDSRSARQARPQLEALYRRILQQQPEAIGAAMPADEFYGP